MAIKYKLEFVIALVIVGLVFFIQLYDEPESSDVVIEISSKQWEFEPSEIQVKQGQSVTLKITSTDISHGFALEEYSIYAFVTPGDVVEINFIANRVGVFEFFCNVFCGEGHSKHRGNLIVI